MIKTAYAFEIKSAFSPAKLFDNVGDLFSDIISVFISVAVILALIFVIIGGIKTVTASGDPKKLGEARMVIFYAIIGLTVSILALVIIQIVQHFLKSTVTIS